jgi:hypothetical protein
MKDSYAGVSGHSVHTGHFSAAGHGCVNKFGKMPKKGPRPFWATRRNRENQIIKSKLGGGVQKMM